MADHYTEKPEVAEPFRQAYKDSLIQYIADEKEKAIAIRTAHVKDIFTDPEKYRQELKKNFGELLLQERKPITLKQEILLGEMDGCEIIRMQFEILDKLLFTGLLFKRKGSGKRPFIISQHGGVGTPEICSSLYEEGSSNYYEMTRRVLKYDVNVFAPQLLLWLDKSQSEGNSTPYRQQADIALKSLNNSITGLELYELESIIDYFEKKDYVDPEKIGMVGLSYGGMFTLLMTAIDPRIKASVSSSFFGVFSFKDGEDWSWANETKTMEDAEIAALCYPRDITLLMGDKDPLFGCTHSEEQFARLKELAKDIPIEQYVRYYTFPGLHEFCQDDQHIEHMMGVLKVEKVK